MGRARTAVHRQVGKGGSMRITLALIAAVVVSGLLFLLMHGLIETDTDEVVGPEKRVVIPFVRVPRDERVETRPRVMPEPPDELEPPPPDPVESKPIEHIPTTLEPKDLPPLDGVDGGLDFGGPRNTATSHGDGDAVAIVQVAPRWPREALIQGIEGWVRVEFIIRTDGSVANPRVIESEPGRLFDQSAIRAIQRWSFRPRVVDGRPVERTATQVIEFRLDDH